ncbi:Hemolysin activation/secretion protein-like protein [Pararobbsia alpina]|uniref:ShlB/FhaC/HecB family hemolysin secretion/activation protein n=1 Tax=Pararobbsia alpina TaxID=621374 RepID=UPI0039A452A3
MRSQLLPHKPARYRVQTRVKRVARAVAAYVALGATVSPAYAQSYRDVAPTPPPSQGGGVVSQAPAQPPENAAQVAVTSLRGLTFVAVTRAGGNAPPEPRSPGVTASGLPLLDDAFLHRFDDDLGKPLTFGRIAEIRRAIIQRYREAGQPLVDVYLPEQDVTDGVVRIAIAEFHLGEVRASGNQYFSSALLVGEMPLKAGQFIRQSDVDIGLTLLNDNPYRHVDVVYAAGSAPNTTDVVLQTDDRAPWRVSAGFDNEGVPQLGRERYSFGADYGNLFGLDQQIAWQLTTSNDVFGSHPSIDGQSGRQRFLANALSYVAPLPWHDRVEVFGVYAQSAPGVNGDFAQDGISAQISLRYDWLLPQILGWKQQAQFGYDFKRSNNNLEFGGVQVFNSNTHIHQFLANYDVSHDDSLGQTHANALAVVSPGSLDGDNNDEAFEASRHGATARYSYFQLSAQRDLVFDSGWSVMVKGLLQWTHDTLLPSEELGLGGEGSVRGYDPYTVLGDRGWNLQTELRTPALPIGTTHAVWQPFVFMDSGHAWNSIDEPAEPGTSTLLSTGVGLRFQFARYVSAQGTFGKPWRAAVPNGSKAPFFEFSVTIGT